MIVATITQKTNQFFSLKITGHASVEKNHSFSALCLAVSVLSRTVTRYLQAYNCISHIIVDDGLLEWQVSDHTSSAVIIAIQILLQGLRDLAYEWPDSLVIQMYKE